VRVNDKPFKELNELVSLLEHRKLRVHNADEASVVLSDLNYYRFTGYARQFQIDPAQGNNQFVGDSSFDTICTLVDLDRQLRFTLLDALTTVEIAIRSRFAHELGRVHGESAFYLEHSNYLASTPDLGKLLETLRGDLLRSRSPMVARYRRGESLAAVPVWVAVEVLSFGSLAKMLYYLTPDEPARAVAHGLSLPWEGFQATIHSLAVLRNRCAHHGQLWHRRLAIQCPVQRKLRRDEPVYEPQGPYAAVIMLKRYLRALPAGDDDWGELVAALLDKDTTFRSGILAPSPK
jgi:abortive infection bacteriophage resistance protein